MTDRLLHTAYHEAGDAVACYWLRMRIRHVSIIPMATYTGK